MLKIFIWCCIVFFAIFVVPFYHARKKQESLTHKKQIDEFMVFSVHG
jgi:hypothetical protein